ncbi:MAG: SH3 domain-containing protein [Lachnospiraceae bacterium]|nr:SH3 domain-containing protein [Lachnospiraceae bacterium]
MRIPVRITAFLLAVMMAITPLGHGAGRASAATSEMDVVYALPKVGTPNYNGNAINIREKASSSSTLVGTVKNGVKFEILGEKVSGDGNLWYRVRFISTSGIHEGYGFASFITVTEATATIPSGVTVYAAAKTGTPSYSGGAINVRKETSSSSELVASVRNETKLTILGEQISSSNNKWYYIRFYADGVLKEGFGYAQYITVYDSDTTVVPTPTVTVTPTPTEEPTVTPTVTPVPTETPSPTPTLPPGVVKDTTYLKTKVGVASNATGTYIVIRSDAKSEPPEVARLDNGTQFDVLGEKQLEGGKVWYRIRYTAADGTVIEGYAHSDYVKVSEKPPKPEVFPSLGYVDYSPTINARKGGSQSAALLYDRNGEAVKLVTGTGVEVLGRSGSYYQCRFDVDGVSTTGYLYADFVRMYDAPSDDADFVADLRAQGFPESYITPLRILHSQHPSWVFAADKTNLDWNTAVNKESEFQRSLVNYVSPTDWKRVDDLGYTWCTADNTDGGFKKLDGFHWEAANRTATAFFMDPRNFLTESELFQFEAQSFDPSIHTLERVQALLEGTFMDGVVPGEYMWESQEVIRDANGVIQQINTVEKTSGTPLTYAQVFLMSAEISGVSPDMLVARVIQEMGTKGTSLIISGTSKTAPGHYNYYDFGTYATADKDAITNGLIYASQTDAKTCRPWNRRWKSLYGGAIMIGREYINRGQDTLYYQKFNVMKTANSYALYSHQYMTNIQAPANEARTMWEACPELDTPILFKIPVYENMPESKAPYPGNKTGNPNPYLKSLTVAGQELDTEFNYKTLSYTIDVSEKTDKLVISAEPLAAKTKVSGIGTVAIQKGRNEILITTTAEYGNQQTYTLIVNRAGEVAPPEPKGAKLSGMNLSIFEGDRLGMNFYLELYGGAASSDYLVEYYLDGDFGNKYSYSLDTLGANVRVADSDYLKCEVKLTTGELSKKIHIAVIEKATNAMLDEAEVACRDYAMTVIASEQDEKVRNMTKAMLNYAAASQTYFEKDVDRLANALLPESDRVVAPIAEDVLDTYRESRFLAMDGLYYYGTSLILDSEIKLRHYFTSDDGSADRYTFVCDGVTLPAVEKNGLWYVEIGGIDYFNITADKVLTVSDTQGASESLGYSVMNYIAMVDGREEYADLLKVVYALYAFSESR